MAVEYQVRSILVNNGPFAALCAARVYPAPLPQTDTSGAEIILPAVTYQRISGATQNDIPFGDPRIQLTVFAETYESAKEVQEAIKDVLQAYKGVVGGVNIHQIVYENDLDLYEPQTERRTLAIDVRVIYQEA